MKTGFCHHWTVRKKIILSVLLSVVIALLGELFLFNGFYWLHGSASSVLAPSQAQNLTIKKSSITIKNVKKDAQLQVNLPVKRYATLELSFKNAEDKASVTAISGGQTLGVRSITGRKVVFSVKKISGPIKLVFSQIKQKNIPMTIVAKNKLTFNWIRFIFIAITVFMASLIIVLQQGKNYAQLAFLAIVLFGSLAAIVIPPGKTFDERQHVIKALSVADGNFDFDNGERVKIPGELEKLYLSADKYQKSPYYSYEEYQGFLTASATKKNERLTNPQLMTTAVTYPFIQYLPEALGMKVAMLFHLPNIYYIWFGRIANVVMYALLAFLAIKLVPQRKRLFTFFALQPVVLYVAASNGFDGILTGVLMLVWAYILKLRVERKKINPFSFASITLLLASMIVFKVTYAPMLLMFFLLGKHNFRSKRQRKVYSVMITFILVFVSLGVYYYSSLKGIDQWGVPGADSAQQLQFILQQPLAYIKLVVKFFAENAIHYTYDFLGSLGHLPQLNAMLVMIGIGWLVFLSLFDAEDSTMSKLNSLNYFTQFEKITQVFQALCIGLLSATALYLTFTPVAAPTIAGFQARYMYPMIFPMFLIISTPKIQNTFSKKSIHFGTMFLALGFITYYIWVKILVPYCL